MPDEIPPNDSPQRDEPNDSNENEKPSSGPPKEATPPQPHTRQVRWRKRQERYQSIGERFALLSDVLSKGLSFFSRLFTALAILIVIAIFVGQLTRRHYTIESLQVPEAFVQDGYSGLVLANKISDRITEIKEQAIQDSTLKIKDYSSSVSESEIDLNLVGVGLPINEIIDYVGQKILGIEKRSVGGELTVQGNRLILTMRITGQPKAQSFEYVVGGQDEAASRYRALEFLIEQAAKYTLESNDPIIMGYYYVGFQQQNFEKAEQMARKVLRRDDKRYRKWAFHILGKSLEDRLPEESVRYYKKATDIDQDFVVALKGWAQLLAEQGKIDEAVEKLRRVQAISPQDKDNLRTLFSCLTRGTIEQIAEAETLFRQGVAQDLFTPEDLYQMGFPLVQEEELTPRSELGVQVWERLVQVDEDGQTAHAGVYETLARFAELRADYGAAVRYAKAVRNVSQQYDDRKLGALSQRHALALADSAAFDSAISVQKESLRFRPGLEGETALLYLYARQGADQAFRQQATVMLRDRGEDVFLRLEGDTLPGSRFVDAAIFRQALARHEEAARAEARRQLEPTRLTLTDLGPSRLRTLGALQDMTGLASDSVATLADSLPALVLPLVERYKAEDFQKRLRSLGAKSELNPAKKPQTP